MGVLRGPVIPCKPRNCSGYEVMGMSRAVLRSSVLRSKRGCIRPFMWLNIRYPPLLILLSGYTVMTYQEAAALGV